jgi:hypothetical protein
MSKRDQQTSLLFRETKQTLFYRNPIQLHAPRSTAPQNSLSPPGSVGLSRTGALGAARQRPLNSLQISPHREDRERNDPPKSPRLSSCINYLSTPAEPAQACLLGSATPPWTRQEGARPLLPCRGAWYTGGGAAPVCSAPRRTKE